jgi:hypothetical protein
MPTNSQLAPAAPNAGCDRRFGCTATYRIRVLNSGFAIDSQAPMVYTRRRSGALRSSPELPRSSARRPPTPTAMWVFRPVVRRRFGAPELGSKVLFSSTLPANHRVVVDFALQRVMRVNLYRRARPVACVAGPEVPNPQTRPQRSDPDMVIRIRYMGDPSDHGTYAVLTSALPFAGFLRARRSGPKRHRAGRPGRRRGHD